MRGLSVSRFLILQLNTDLQVIAFIVVRTIGSWQTFKIDLFAKIVVPKLSILDASLVGALDKSHMSVF